MLSSRCLLRYIYVIEKICASSKSTNNGKPNVIKSLNTENKLLYGNLVETQKQRKQIISKVVDQDEKNRSVAGSELQVTTPNSESEFMKKNTSKQRMRKPKFNQSVTLSSGDSVYILPSDRIVSVPVSSLEVESLKNVETRHCNKNNSKQRTKKIKPITNSSDLLPTPSVVENEITGSKIHISSDEFLFKSALPINETNYPLENPEKLISHDSTVEQVLNYSFNDPAIKQYINFPSVSKIMEETMSDKNKSILSKWRQNMINDLGEDGFYKHCSDLKIRGQEFHMAVRNAVLDKPTDNCSEVTRNGLKSLSWLLKHISNPMAVESIIAHPKLGYKGIPDCVAMFRNVHVVIDWKLSDKPKRDLKDTYEAPVQISAYIGALNHDPNYKWAVNHGLVAVAYSNGDPCDVFLLAPKHCQIYWRHWLMRFDKFKARSHLHVDHDIDEKALEFI